MADRRIERAQRLARKRPPRPDDGGPIVVEIRRLPAEPGRRAEVEAALRRIIAGNTPRSDDV